LFEVHPSSLFRQASSSCSLVHNSASTVAASYCYCSRHEHNAVLVRVPAAVKRERSLPVLYWIKGHKGQLVPAFVVPIAHILPVASLALRRVLLAADY
jgi:hypothetical protein